MNIKANPFVSIQNSVSSAIHSITDGAEQVAAVKAAQISTALDSFQSVQSDSPLIQTPSVFSDAGSFAHPLSFYQQNSESSVAQYLKNPNFSVTANLQELTKDLGKWNELFASTGGSSAAVNSSLTNSNFTVPSEIDLKLKELRDQLASKKQEYEEIRQQIKQKTDEIKKKQEELASGPEWSTGVPVVDDILGEVLGKELGPKPDPSALHQLEREVEELQASADKVRNEIQDLTMQMEQLQERKKDLERSYQTGPVNKTEQKLMVDPFLASIEIQPDQIMLNFSRAIQQQLEFQIFPQRSMFIRA